MTSSRRGNWPGASYATAWAAPKAGDVASKMAVEAFCTQMDQLGDLEGPPPAEALLRTATEDANRVVYLKAQTDADCIGMGTTLWGSFCRRPPCGW